MTIREPAPAPPKGFRPHMSLKVKLEALLINGPVLDSEGRKVCDPKAIDWDHCPPLMLRVWDEAAGDTDPPANDPAHIVPRIRDDHREKTATRDVPAIAKAKRCADEHDEFRRRLLEKDSGADRDHPKPKGRRLQGRGFQKRRAG
jgi:hypothetical protein